MPRLIEILLTLNDARLIQIDLTKVGPAGQSGAVDDRIYIDPVSFLASDNIQLPAAPQDGKRVVIHCGGTIAPGELVVDALTVQPNAGQTVYQAITPVQAYGGDVFTYQYQASTSMWRRI